VLEPDAPLTMRRRSPLFSRLVPSGSRTRLLGVGRAPEPCEVNEPGRTIDGHGPSRTGTDTPCLGAEGVGVVTSEASLKLNRRRCCIRTVELGQHNVHRRCRAGSAPGGACTSQSADQSSSRSNAWSTDRTSKSLSQVWRGATRRQRPRRASLAQRAPTVEAQGACISHVQPRPADAHRSKNCLEDRRHAPPPARGSPSG